MVTREGALTVLRKLEQAGFAAYFAGGCVRDTLLGRPVHDWDVATAARPERVQALFPRTVPTGIRHGTVTVLLDGGGCEVTTFRAESGYSDARRPDAVEFLSDLAGDLSRRDFTVNAMALDAAGNLTDLHGGRADLERGLIRCVGDPAARFSEDALRMLRAVRFSAQLGFSLEPGTERAAAACAPLCARLSAERVRDELEKTLLSPRPRAVERMLALGLLRSLGLEAGPSLEGLARAACERTARWAALKRALPAIDLEGLRLDRKTASLARKAASLSEATEASVKRLAAEQGREAAKCACDSLGQRALFEALEASGTPLTLRELAVSGRDLDWLEGPEIGKTLRRLLDYVLEHPEENEKRRLLDLARQ